MLNRIQTLGSNSVLNRFRMDTKAVAGIFVAITGSDVTGTGTMQNPYRTIQHAIDVSVDGNTIWVGAGEYTAPGGSPQSTPVISLEKNIHIIAYEGPMVTTLNGEDTGSNDGHQGAFINYMQEFGTEVSCPIVEGFTFQDCYAPNGGAALIGGPQDSGPPQMNGTGMLRNCILDNCKASGTGGGVRLETLIFGGVYDCIIRNCSASEGGGIVTSYTYQPNTGVHNTLIHGCTSSSVGGGIASKEGLIITHTTLAENHDNAASGFASGGIFWLVTSVATRSITDSVVATNTPNQWNRYAPWGDATSWVHCLTNTDNIGTGGNPPPVNCIDSDDFPPVFTGSYGLQPATPGAGMATDGKDMGWLGLTSIPSPV